MAMKKKLRLSFKITMFLVFGIINFGYADFQEDCLKAHNEYRKKHNAQPLELDPKITKIAQDYADKLINLQASGRSGNEAYGENLYSSFNEPANAKATVKAWYDEIEDYNFKNPGYSPSTGRFTQVVWKASKKLGCAFAAKDKIVEVVANYEPPGNIFGLYGQNVEAGANRVLNSIPPLLLHKLGFCSLIMCLYIKML